MKKLDEGHTLIRIRLFASISDSEPITKIIDIDEGNSFNDAAWEFGEYHLATWWEYADRRKEKPYDPFSKKESG